MIEIVQIIHMMIQAAEKYYRPINTGDRMQSRMECVSENTAWYKKECGVRGKHSHAV